MLFGGVCRAKGLDREKAGNEGCVTVTQRTGQTRPGLIRLREAAARNPKLRFTNLLHHIDIDLLDEAYRVLNRRRHPILSSACV